MSESKNKSVLIKQIDQAIKRTGGADSNFLYAVKFHLDVLANSKTEDELDSREEMCRYLFSKMFIDNMALYPAEPFVCKVEETSAWPVKPMPSEFFGDEKLSEEHRKQWFYRCLKVGDVLDCRVSSVSPNSGQLRVIHKYGSTRIFDGLDIMVELVFTKNEIKILKDPLLPCQLVRVAVYKIDKNIVHITVDSENIQIFKTLPKLGRITENDVPSYVLQPPDLEKYDCYADYLKSKPQFNNPHFYLELIKLCGLNPYVSYSFFPKLNMKEIPWEQSGQALLNDAKLRDAREKANLAIKNFRNKQYCESLKLTEEAILVCPEKDPLMSRLYSIKADILAAEAKPKPSLKSCLEMEKAFNKNPVDDHVKMKFIKKLLESANWLYCQKRFKEAVAAYEYILKFDENNVLSLRVLNRIKTKYADKLLDLESTSLNDLHEKKKKILSQLKKIGS